MAPAVRKRLFQIGFLVLVQAVALFASAWSWAWWNAWAYLVLYLLYLVFNAFALVGKHTDLVEERTQVGAGAKTWDKLIAVVTGLAGFTTLVLSGLDQRFNWAGSLPLWVQVFGFVLLALSYPLFTWAMVSNRFFSTVVRIQKDRGHTVQTGGPYRYVRHPGYASLLVSYVSLPFALGSWWACIPVAVLVINLLVRTHLEDRTLHNELEGYDGYARRVRFRLVPGIW